MGPIFSFLSLLDDRFPDYGKVEFVFSYGPEKIQGTDDVLALSLQPCLCPPHSQHPPTGQLYKHDGILEVGQGTGPGRQSGLPAKPDPAP